MYREWKRVEKERRNGMFKTRFLNLCACETIECEHRRYV